MFTPVPHEIIERILDFGSAEKSISEVEFCGCLDPFAHPNLLDLIDLVLARKISLIIATELNLSGIEESIRRVAQQASGLLMLEVSIFHECAAKEDHTRQNLHLLSDALKEANQQGNCVKIRFHYTQRNAVQASEFRKLADELGFVFEEVPLLLQPIEVGLTEIQEGMISPEFLPSAQELVLLPSQLRGILSAAAGHGCSFRGSEFMIDAQGCVMTCRLRQDVSDACGSILTDTLTEIQNRKNTNSFCAECIRQGLPVYYFNARKWFSCFH